MVNPGRLHWRMGGTLGSSGSVRWVTRGNLIGMLILWVVGAGLVRAIVSGGMIRVTA